MGQSRGHDGPPGHPAGQTNGTTRVRAYFSRDEFIAKYPEFGALIEIPEGHSVVPLYIASGWSTKSTEAACALFPAASWTSYWDAAQHWFLADEKIG